MTANNARAQTKDPAQLVRPGGVMQGLEIWSLNLLLF